MSTVPKPFPKEFREDVIRVFRSSDASAAQVAKDFGISESCLHRWIALDDVDLGKRPGVTSSESAELRELRELRKRNRLLEQENEVLRRAAAYLSQANLPASQGK
jgi:transposase-like protein